MAFFTDTFASDAVDTSPPTNWGNASPPANGTWAIKDLPPHYMRYSPINNTASSVGWTAVGNNRVFNFTGKISNTDTNTAGVAASGFLFDDATFQNRFHVFAIADGAVILIVYKDGTQNSTTTLYAAGTISPNTANYNVKIQFDGNAKTLMVKAWLDSGSEPSFQDMSAKIAVWTVNPSVGIRAFGNPKAGSNFVGVYSTQATVFQTVAITGTSAAQSAVTGTAAMQWSIGSTSAAQSSVTGLAGLQRPITGTSAAQSAVTGAMTVQRNMTGTSAAASTAAGTLNATWGITSTSAAQSSVTGAANVTWALGSTCAAQSAVTGAMTTQRGMAGTSAAASAVAGTLNATWGMASTSAAQSDVTGTAQLEQSIDAAITAQSTLDSTLDLLVPINGQVEALSGVSATLIDSRLLNGSSAAVSFVIGTLDSINAQLEGTITAVSDLVLLELKPLMVTVNAVSTVQGNLNSFAILRMNAQVNFETHLIAQKPYWG